jgi:DNA-binding transcriptional MerR regulator
LTEPTLRYYEEIGLIEPVLRDGSSRHRRYDTETVGWIESIAILRTAGLSIEEMRTYLHLRDQGDSVAYQMEQLFSAHIVELEAQIKRLRARQRYLAAKVSYWQARGRGDTAETARLVEEFTRISKQLKK